MASVQALLPPSPREESVELTDSSDHSTPLTDFEDYADNCCDSPLPDVVDIVAELNSSNGTQNLKRRRSPSLTIETAEKRTRLDVDPPISSLSPSPQLHSSSSSNEPASWPVVPQSISFLALPREIRDQIYELAFLRPSVRPVCYKPLFWEDQSAIYRPTLGYFTGLLYVSRQLSLEAASVLYGKNKFVVYGMDTGVSALDWITRIGDSNRDLINTITLDWQHAPRKLKIAETEGNMIDKLNVMTGPLKRDLAVAIHTKVQAHCQMIADCLKPFRQTAEKATLKHLSAMMPGQESAQHPNNFCATVGCSGCTDMVRDVFVDIKGLETLTVGDTEWKGESEAMAKQMGVPLLHVTNTEFVEFTDESVAELKEQGWEARILWRNPDDDDEYWRMLTKRIKPVLP